MKKKFLLTTLLIASTLSGCVKYNGRTTGPSANVDEAVKTIVCDPVSLVFNKGDEKKKVTPTVNGDGEFNDAITIKSNDASIATVSESTGNSGTAFYVNPIAVGTTKIVVTSVANSTVFCEVSVEVNDKDAVIPVSEVKINKTSLTLSEGASEQLTATVLPDNATDKSVTWSSSDSNVATVDNNGNVTALAEGSATILATSADGTKTGECAVTVTADDTITNGYYLVGSMTGNSDYDWKPHKKYKMIDNPDKVGTEIQITFQGKLNMEVKVIKYTQGQEYEWYQPSGDSGSTDAVAERTGDGGNMKLLANATFTLYLELATSHYWVVKESDY